MFALECASLMTRRLNLLYERIGDADQQAVSQALENGRHRCPGAVPDAVSSAVERLLEQAENRRPDQLMGLWAIAGDDARNGGTKAQMVWLGQLSRRLLPRPAIEALLGLDRDTVLGLIGSEKILEEERIQRDLGFCDNHLHSGAADELGDLLERLVPRVAETIEPRKLQSAVGPEGSGSGTNVNAGPIVLALSAACTVLSCPDEPQGHDEALLAGIDWWRAARTMAYDEKYLDSTKFGSHRKTIEAVAIRNGAAPQLSVLYDALTKVAAGASFPMVKSRAVRRGLIALCALHDLIVVPPGSNLGNFVRKFELMRTVRGLFGDDRGRLESALRTMYIYGSVTSVELRKSIVAGSERTVSVGRILASIQKDMGEHATSAMNACKALNTEEMIVRMPLTFTRRDPKPVDMDSEPRDFVPFRAPVAETLAVADAIVLATADECRARFVGAVDVVGNEKMVPNWLYALAYKRIARASSLEFTCHAGEYFADSLEGLRRIGEAAQSDPAKITRIGHCLSLGVARGTEQGANNEASVLLENAIWALLMLEGRAELGLGNAAALDAPKNLARELTRTMLMLAPYIFDTKSLSVEDICEWYLRRFDPDTVARWVPELLEPSHTRTQWRRSRSRRRLPKISTPLEAMLGATIYEMDTEITGGGSTQRIRYKPKATLPNPLVERSRDLLNKAKPFAVAAVRQWLISNRIVIESCPSSNAALVNIAITQHPIWSYHNEGLICSVNTDDPTLFGAALNEEYVHAGMVADENGGHGASFVRELAEASRTVGTVQRPLCDSTERPTDTYRAVLNSMGPYR
jgi:hypothetical protein